MKRRCTEFYIFFAATYCFAAPTSTSKVRIDEKPMDDVLLLDDVTDTWEAPAYLKENFPYSLSGYDEENRPIVILPFGKWDWTSALDHGNVSIADLNKLAVQIIYRIKKWASSPNSPGDVAVILDFDEFSTKHIASKGAIEHALSVFKAIGALREKIAYGFFVNTNFAADLLINAGRPLFGNVLEKFEQFGARKDQWIPRLSKILPKDQLPPKYGGRDGFKPVFTFGNIEFNI